MMKALRAALLAALVLPSVAIAQVTLGLRAGYGIPSGDLQKDSKLKDQIKSQVPIQLDAMYWVVPRASVGLYASYGFGQVADELKDQFAFLGPGTDYSVSTYRVGLQATYAFPMGGLAPWLGLGSGLEVGTFELENGGAKVTGTSRGWEFANLQAGVDYAITSGFGAGLFASWSIGNYTYQGGKVSGTGVIDGETGGGLGSDASTHSWFVVGLRGTFDL